MKLIKALIIWFRVMKKSGFDSKKANEILVRLENILKIRRSRLNLRLRKAEKENLEKFENLFGPI